MFEIDLYKQWVVPLLILFCIIGIILLSIYKLIQKSKDIKEVNLKQEFIIIFISFLLAAITIGLYKSYNVTNNKEYNISIEKCYKDKKTCSIIINGDTISLVSLGDISEENNNYLDYSIYYKNKWKEINDESNIDYKDLHLTEDVYKQFMEE